MQMHQIRYFLALCEERNFTRAARRRGVSQPSLTNAIGALEQELGGKLFYRKPVIALTALGQMMAPYLEQIARNADHASETARAWREATSAGPRVPPDAAAAPLIRHRAHGVRYRRGSDARLRLRARLPASAQATPRPVAWRGRPDHGEIPRPRGTARSAAACAETARAEAGSRRAPRW